MARPSIPSQVQRSVKRLRELLPEGWQVDVFGFVPGAATLRIASEREEGKLALWTRKRLEPRDVQTVAELRTSKAQGIVASPWLSPRTRELLRARGVGYIDDTGNIEIQMSTPAVYIRTDGADRDPNPKPTAGPTLRGPRAWALLRTLVEVAPPYGVRELSERLRVDAGYVSRVLKVLEGELLIERPPRGAITSVDWEGVLRQLASTYSFFGANETSTWVAPGGAEQLLGDLVEKRSGTWAVTGSFASSSIVPVAAPETAFIFTIDPDRLARVGRLLPATTGANVVLAVPYDEIVFERTRKSAKVPFVSTAQTAVDDLTGTGRMPEEGEALVAWMRRNLRRWQATSLTSPRAAS
jgi:hypothetical protein